ncbi:MAG: hypothetical protein WCP58_05860 [bacterium]
MGQITAREQPPECRLSRAVGFPLVTADALGAAVPGKPMVSGAVSVPGVSYTGVILVGAGFKPAHTRAVSA